VEGGRETAGLTTRLILAYVRRRSGEAGVTRVLELAGATRSADELEDERAWGTYAAKVALFEAAARVTDDPYVARRVGEAVLSERIAGTLRLAVGALGSPRQVLRSVAAAHVKFSTVAEMRTLTVRRNHAVVTYRLQPGYEPSRHDCRYTQGLLTQVPVLFGLPPARLHHTACQVDGAVECRYEVVWQARRPWWARPLRRRGTIAERNAAVLRGHVVDLERSVADLVSARDVEEVLRGVAERASTVVRAQRHLLAVRPDGGAATMLGQGFDDEEVRAVGERLLEVGPEGPVSPDRLVVEVLSARRHYGWLAAYLPEGESFPRGEDEHLRAYAGLAAAALDSRATLAEARRHAATSDALLTLGHDIAREDDEVAVAQLVVEAVPDVVGASRGSLLRWDAERQQLRMVAVSRFGELRDEALALTVPRGATPILEALVDDLETRWLVRPYGDPFLDALHDRLDGTAMALQPIVMRGELFGVLVASWRTGEPHPVRCAELFRGLDSLAEQAAVALANIRLLATIRHQATHDTLTGLAGRSLFLDRATQALAAAERTGAVTGLCFLDLDGFKDVNDRFGHAAGDALLEQLAGRLGRAVRAGDTVARMSGDEFAVLLVDVDGPEVALRTAEELAAVVRRPVEVLGGPVRVGASIGLALAPEHGRDPEALLYVADEAMYLAKVAGTGPQLGAPAGCARR
jgi:diguanylate cyclase (GGDEF)-like protein